jgi:hypothetical protein
MIENVTTNLRCTEFKLPEDQTYRAGDYLAM